MAYDVSGVWNVVLKYVGSTPPAAAATAATAVKEREKKKKAKGRGKQEKNKQRHCHFDIWRSLGAYIYKYTYK